MNNDQVCEVASPTTKEALEGWGKPRRRVVRDV